MKNMLPIPFIEHIPPYEGAESLCAKMDEIFLRLRDEILSLKHALDPFACKSVVLGVFGEFLSANFKSTDTEKYKRDHIWTAIQDNKMFGTWTQVKNVIDGICGGDSSGGKGADLVFDTPVDMWALLGDGFVTEEKTWSILGLDSKSAESNQYGIALEGVPTLWQKGVFNIDVGNDHLTQKQIAQLYEALYPTTPVGMTIRVGYMVGTELVPYFTLGGFQDD